MKYNTHNSFDNTIHIMLWSNVIDPSSNSVGLPLLVLSYGRGESVTDGDARGQQDSLHIGRYGVRSKGSLDLNNRSDMLTKILTALIKKYCFICRVYDLINLNISDNFKYNKFLLGVPYKQILLISFSFLNTLSTKYMRSSFRSEVYLNIKIKTTAHILTKCIW